MIRSSRSNAILDQVVCVLNDLGLPRDPALRTSEVVKRLRSQGVSWWKHNKATHSHIPRDSIFVPLGKKQFLLIAANLEIAACCPKKPFQGSKKGYKR